VAGAPIVGLRPQSRFTAYAVGCTTGPGYPPGPTPPGRQI